MCAYAEIVPFLYSHSLSSVISTKLDNQINKAYKI